MDIEKEFKDELFDVFDNAVFFNKVEYELAIFQALIDEVNYYADRVNENDLDPEQETIRKEDLKEVYKNYLEYKEHIHQLLEEYMVRIKDTGIPVNFGYYKILKNLREE